MSHVALLLKVSPCRHRLAEFDRGVAAGGLPKVSTSMTLAQNLGVEAVNVGAPGPSHHHHRQGGRFMVYRFVKKVDTLLKGRNFQTAEGGYLERRNKVLGFGFTGSCKKGCLEFRLVEKIAMVCPDEW